MGKIYQPVLYFIMRVYASRINDIIWPGSGSSNTPASSMIHAIHDQKIYK